MTRPYDEIRHSGLIVVGSGVAGLTTALAAPTATVLTKGRLGVGGSSEWAQGGIAAAVAEDDSPEQHAADTIAVAGGIAVPEVVAALTRGGPDAVDRVRMLGGRFDVTGGGDLALGKEAGHRRRRIIHAHGDATGAELMRALRAATAASQTIDVVEEATVVDLARSRGRIVGVLARHGGGRMVLHLGSGVVLATGGIGRLYARTTNPGEVTGDGLAIAARAGARLADLEFVQFHPTALAADLDPMPLLTEALRGEGAVLVDGGGGRFMREVHPDAELAPRDVVARAIWRRLEVGDEVFLDASRAVGPAFPDRFPTVYAHATRAGIDPRREPMPVSPAAHYFMGGIAVDAEGQSSLPGLWAVGEAASTGVHGANRLASNSLLEGLVFGLTVAESAHRNGTVPPPAHVELPDPPHHFGLRGSVVAEVRELMWHHVGLVRDEEGLEAALGKLADLATRVETLEARNAVVVATLVTTAALARTESRGSHFRSDHPSLDPAQAHRTFVKPDAAPAVHDLSVVKAA